MTLAVGSGLSVLLPVAGASTTALPANVRQLLQDLRAIAPGSIVTDEQKQALAADLTALATGLVQPSASVVDQLADDLAATVAGGHLTHKVEIVLASDLATVFNASNASNADPARVQAAINEVATLLAAYGVNAADRQPLGVDLDAIIDGLLTGHAVTQRTVTLHSENIPPFLLMNYAGRARLVTVATEGRATQSVLTLDASGLPPTNPYTVAVTRRSDGGVVVLGKLKVRAARPVVHAGVPGAGGGEIVQPQAELDTHADAVFGGPAGRPLPDGFDPADVDTLTLTDDHGTERLAGGFADDSGDVLRRSRLVSFRLDAGAADPGANGVVSFRTKTVGGGTRDLFSFYAGGLPAGAVVTLVADGVAVGQFTTTAGGILVIQEGPVPVPTTVVGRMLPVNALPVAVDLNTLTTLTLTDAAGDVLASGGM